MQYTNERNQRLRGHRLLSKALRKQLPALYATEELGDEALVQVKFFSPYTNWTWYATEFDGKDTFFGLVIGHYPELGYFSLSELAGTTKFGVPAIERDLHFTPTPLKDIKKLHQL